MPSEALNVNEILLAINFDLNCPRVAAQAHKHAYKRVVKSNISSPAIDAMSSRANGSISTPAEALHVNEKLLTMDLWLS